MVNLGARQRAPEEVPGSLMEAERQGWQVKGFPQVSYRGASLTVIIPPADRLERNPANAAQVAAYARQNPDRVRMLWIRPEGRTSELSGTEREAALVALSNPQTTFQEEMRQSAVQQRVDEFRSRLDGIMGNPFNPERTLYEVFRAGIFTEAESERDPELQRRYREILSSEMTSFYGDGFNYDNFLEEEKMFGEFLDNFAGHLSAGRYHDACKYALGLIHFPGGEERFAEMYAMALEDYAGIPASAIQEWRSEGRLLEASDRARFGAMLYNAVGNESFLAQYPSESWNEEEKRSIEIFQGRLGDYLSGISLTAEEKERIKAEIYANWNVTTNPTLRSAMAIEYFRATGQDIGSPEMQSIYERRWPTGTVARR